MKANGGCCLVAWEKVMRPIDLGGLRILNLEVMVGPFHYVGYGWRKQIKADLGLDL
jgi:hypothetical protein